MAFLAWMLEHGLSPSSAKKYADALDGVLSQWAESAELADAPLSEVLDVAIFDDVAEKLAALPVFIERNERGHQMYSSALANFRKYLQALESDPIAALGSDYPPHARVAKSYVLSAEAKNLSGAGTLREGRWPTIKEYDGHPNGVQLAYKAGRVSRRQLYMYERRGMLKFDTSSQTVNLDRYPATIATESEESKYPEGAVSYRLHRHRERDGTLPALAKEKRRAERGSLTCDVCSFNFSAVYGALGEGYIEAHHTVPISSMDGTEKTRVEDIALVCSNCHRMLHSGPHLLSIPKLKEVIATANPQKH